MEKIKDVRDKIVFYNPPGGKIDIQFFSNTLIELCDHIADLESQINQAGNKASCLANGIMPD